MKRFVLFLLIIVMLIPSVGCMATPDANQVYIQTIWGKPTKVVHPPGIWTITVFGDEYHDLDLTDQTDEFGIRSASNDNASFHWPVKYSYRVLGDDTSIMKHVAKFGVDPEVRKAKLRQVMFGRMQAEFGDAANKYDAYKLVANTDNVQRVVKEKLDDFFAKEFYIKLESLEPVGKPDFDNNDIELAAAKVVANQKNKEAEAAGLDADKIRQQRQEIEAQIMSNPALKQIKLLEIQKEIEEARAKGISNHKGNLTIIYGGDSARPTVTLNNN